MPYSELKNSPVASSEPPAPTHGDARNPVKVFFDGGCPLCRREIDHYRRLSALGPIEWIDIAIDDDALRNHGLTREAAMARFHVLDTADQWQTGVPAFLELWSHLPVYRWMARILRASRLENLLDKVYVRFASWRLRRRCDNDSCSTN
jgi:predicted DCC family thiol-disulfide oxidoreductase YuxK